MAGSGNVPKGGKQTTTTPSNGFVDYIVTSDVDYLSSTSPVRLYTLGGYAMGGSLAGDWFFMAGAGNTTSRIDGRDGLDWLSFQTVTIRNSSYSIDSGVQVNLGNRFTAFGLDVLGNRFSTFGINGGPAGSVVNVENVWGSIGNDILIGTATQNEMHGGLGNDKLFGIDGNDLLYGEEGNDVMVGGAGNVSFNGGAGNDYMQSARGNDWIDGGDPGPGRAPPTSTFQDPTTSNSNLPGGGLSFLNYGDSADYGYLPSGWRIVVTLAGDTWVEATIYDDQGRVRERDKLKNVENIVGGVGNDPLVGDGNGNLLDGGGGNDTVTGGGGDDLLLGGGGGNDDLDGGDGTDEISFVPIIDPIAGLPEYSPANNKINDNKSLVLDLRLDSGRGRYSFNTLATSATLAPSGGPGIMAGSVDDPWRGAMSSIENVTGTDKNDQIAGTLGINILNGYGGNDLLYGAGGNDTLIGGEGTDWAMFRDATPGNQPRYLTNVENIDPVLILYNDINDPYASGGVLRLDTGRFFFAGSTGQLASMENLLGSTGNDVIVGDTGANILVGEAGSDTMFGGDGNDRIFGGDVPAGGYDLGKMDALWGGRGNDLFLVGYDYNPVVGTALVVSVGADTGVLNTEGALPTEVGVRDYGIIRIAGTADGASLDFHNLVQDWQSGDKMFLAKDWTAVIAGLGSEGGSRFAIADSNAVTQTAYDWSGNDVVDLRSINGTGANNENKTAADLGKIVVSTGDGNDTIYGSNGNDWIFAGKGRNDIILGNGPNDGADRVFITSFVGQYNVSGFDAEDRLYINRSVIDALTPAGSWWLGRGLSSISDPSAVAGITTGQAYSTDFWNPLSTIIFNPTYSSFLNVFPPYNPANQPIELNLPVVGSVFSQPLWQSNGAWTNNAHTYAELAADLAVGGAGGVQIAIGTALLGIPIVGLIIGTPFIVSGALMIRDAAQESQHLNTTYDNGSYRLASETQLGIPNVDPFGIPIAGRPTIQAIGNPSLLANAPYTFNFGNFSLQAGPLDATPTVAELVTALRADPRYAAGPVYIDAVGNDLVVTTKANGPTTDLARISSGLTSMVSFMDTQNPGASASVVGQWDAKRLLDFFNIPNDKFVPTLEVTSHPVKEGIYSIVAVYNGTETFIFLVASVDRMIQNNEALLIAQVNGQVSADQIVLYDDSPAFADINRYVNEPAVTPVPAPVVSSIAIISDADEKDPVSGQLLTTDATPTITISFDKPLVAGDSVAITYRGSVVSSFTAPQTGDQSLTLTLPGVTSDGAYDLAVEVTNAQGFSSSTLTQIGIDANPILASDITLRGVETGVIFGFRANTNPAGQASNGAAPELATARISLANGTELTTEMNQDNGYSPTLAVSAQPSASQGTLSVTDAYGRTTELTGYSATLGSNGGDTITGVGSVVNYLYGFGGNDSITGAGLADILVGGTGNDTLSGLGGDDNLFGGQGNDRLTGGSGSDVFIMGSSGALNDSDTITDFATGNGGDVLDVSAFLPGATFSASDFIVATNGWNGSSTGNSLAITGKIVQLWSYAADSSADVDSAAEILQAFTDGILTLANGGKGVILSGEDTSNQTGYVWFVHDSGNDGVDLADITLVATLDAVRMGTFVPANLFA